MEMHGVVNLWALRGCGDTRNAQILHFLTILGTTLVHNLRSPIKTASVKIFELIHGKIEKLLARIFLWRHEVQMRCARYCLWDHHCLLLTIMLLSVRGWQLIIMVTLILYFDVLLLLAQFVTTSLLMLGDHHTRNNFKLVLLILLQKLIKFYRDSLICTFNGAIIVDQSDGDLLNLFCLILLLSWLLHISCRCSFGCLLLIRVQQLSPIILIHHHYPYTYLQKLIITSYCLPF